MNPLRRYELIMGVLLESKEVTVAELSERLGVTGKTIREDLGKLEERGLLRRIHGGAVLSHGDQFGILSVREPHTRNAAGKQEIAAAALKLITEDDIVALDGGSTTLEIARALPNRHCTIVTNDLYIISELVRKDRIRLVVPGGYRVRNVLAGEEAAEQIRRLNIGVAFLSATAIHHETGLSVYTSEVIAVKRAMIDVARKVYAVVDHSKFGRTALRTFAALSELDGIVTDTGLPDAEAEAVRRAGTVIYTVE
jgi:DeoR family fructose operon transcriptional repressor